MLVFGWDLCYTDPAQHLRPAAEHLSDLPDLSDLFVRRVQESSRSLILVTVNMCALVAGFGGWWTVVFGGRFLPLMPSTVHRSMEVLDLD